MADTFTAVFGSVSPTDDGAQYVDSGDGVYTDYVVENKYYFDAGMVGMAVASPNGFQGASSAFVNLGAPTLLWVCDWTCCMAGAQPKIPQLKPADANWVLIFAAPVTRSVGATGDGNTALYRISGTYVYQHANPSQNVYDQVRFGLSPDLNPAGFKQTATDLTQPGIADAP